MDDRSYPEPTPDSKSLFDSRSNDGSMLIDGLGILNASNDKHRIIIARYQFAGWLERSGRLVELWERSMTKTGRSQRSQTIWDAHNLAYAKAVEWMAWGRREYWQDIEEQVV